MRDLVTESYKHDSGDPFNGPSDLYFAAVPVSLAGQTGRVDLDAGGVRRIH